MNPLDLVMDLLWDLFAPAKNSVLRAFLQIFFMIVLLAVYIFLFTQCAGLVSLLVKNRYVVVVIDMILLVLLAAILYFLLRFLSHFIKK
ncbi:MAG: hypothetical protein IJX62_07780 [Clostridia bacterium]|nr:hypothetical protein [Clostridia bacterium]